MNSPDGSQPDSNRPLTLTLFKAGVEHLKNLYKCRRCGADLVVQFRMENSYEPVYGCQTCNPIEEDEVTNHTPVPEYEMAESPRKRAERVRDFPTNTCGASRHLHNVASLIADDAVDGDWCICTHEDPEHVAESIFSTIASLWEARTALNEAKAESRREVLAEVDVLLAAASTRASDTSYEILQTGSEETVLHSAAHSAYYVLLEKLRREIAALGDLPNPEPRQASRD